MGHFASGVTVMTTAVADRLHGMTVSAFASVSLEPLLLLVVVERATLMHRLVMESKAFAVNILGEAGEASARAVELCGQRWHAAGRKVQVVMPDTGSDLNDQLMAAAP